MLYVFLAYAPFMSDAKAVIDATVPTYDSQWYFVTCARAADCRRLLEVLRRACVQAVYHQGHADAAQKQGRLSKWGFRVAVDGFGEALPRLSNAWPPPIAPKASIY